MALDIDQQNEAPKRPIGLAVMGVLLLAAAGYVYYGYLQQTPASKPVPFDYQYTIKQSNVTEVSYFNNSFFENGPGNSNTGYVANLTESLNTQFHYDYSASEPIELTYTYGITATVKGSYLFRANEENLPKVWSKEYRLLDPTTKTVRTKTISLSPDVEVPYAKYKKEIDDLNGALGLSLSGEAVITMTVRVSGSVEGTPFKDIKVASVTAPLDQQIFVVSSKYQKKSTNQVAGQQTSGSFNIRDYWQQILSGTLGLLGGLLLVVGFRRQIFKTPYQRELDRIYRMHDGIIIRASKPADLAGKNVVAVRSFDDLLNLEEELKTPIVASPAGGEATHFVIIHNDVAYVYTLGKVLVEDGEVDEIEEALHPVRAQRVREAAKKPKHPRKIM